MKRVRMLCQSTKTTQFNRLGAFRQRPTSCGVLEQLEERLCLSGPSLEAVNNAPQTVGAIADIQVLGFQRIGVDLPQPLFEDVDGDAMHYEMTQANDSPVDWLTLDGQRIVGRPTNAQAGLHDLKIVASDPSGATADAPFQVNVQLNDFPWHHPARPFDIDDNGLFIQPQDVATMARYLVLHGLGPLPTGGPNPAAVSLVDVYPDSYFGTRDLQLFMSQLFLHSKVPGGQGEGEGGSEDATPALLGAANIVKLQRPDLGPPTSDVATDQVFSQPAPEDFSSAAAAHSTAQVALELASRSETRDRPTLLLDWAIEESSWWGEPSVRT